MSPEPHNNIPRPSKFGASFTFFQSLNIKEVFLGRLRAVKLLYMFVTITRGMENFHKKGKKKQEKKKKLPCLEWHGELF